VRKLSRGRKKTNKLGQSDAASARKPRKASTMRDEKPTEKGGEETEGGPSERRRGTGKAT